MYDTLGFFSRGVKNKKVFKDDCNLVKENRESTNMLFQGESKSCWSFCRRNGVAVDTKKKHIPCMFLQ